MTSRFEFVAKALFSGADRVTFLDEPCLSGFFCKMIKPFVKSLRTLKNLLPKALIERLKSQQFIIEQYKALLRHVGIIGRVQDWNHQANDYRQLLLAQKDELQAKKSANTVYVLCLFAYKLVDIKQSLESLKTKEIKVSSIAIISPNAKRILKQLDKLDDFASFNFIDIYQLKKFLNDSGTRNSDKKSSETKSLETIHFLLLNAGDTLHAKAFEGFESQDLSTADMAYCDTDYIDEHQEHVLAEFYPSWDPVLQISCAYLSTGVLLISRALKERFTDMSYSSIASFVRDAAQFSIVKKIDYVLVHKNKHALMLMQKKTFYPGFDIEKLQWPIDPQFVNEPKPLVSLIIPTKNGFEILKTCIDSIIEKTTYLHYEIIVIDNASDEQNTLEYLSEISSLSNVKVIKYPHEFNYSAINNFAVDKCSGSLIALVNNDIEVISPNWLDRMVELCVREKIACVGAKLLYPNKLVQHAGVVLGYGGGAGHAHKYFFGNGEGYLGRLSNTNCYSAVTAACLLVKRSDYLKVGGLNEHDLKVAFNDVDFCLKVRELGKHNVYCAEAELFHYESISRGLDTTPEKKARFESELRYLQTKWQGYIDKDPCYNTNLTLRSENFSVKHAPITSDSD